MQERAWPGNTNVPEDAKVLFIALRQARQDVQRGLGVAGDGTPEDDTSRTRGRREPREPRREGTLRTVRGATWVVERHQRIVGDDPAAAAQAALQNARGAVDHLHQIVPHGAGDIEDEGQGGISCGGGQRLPGLVRCEHRRH